MGDEHELRGNHLTNRDVTRTPIGGSEGIESPVPNQAGQAKAATLAAGCASPKFTKRILDYLQNCRQNAIVMLGALDRGDFETVTRLGHQMSGSGGMFGFPAIADICGALEQAAGNADNDESRMLVCKLSTYLDGIVSD